MGIKMKNAPVYFTIAQVKFNPVLNMEGYLPVIQERMRATHFPDFKRESIQRLIIPFNAQGEGSLPPSPSFVPQARCFFGNIESSTDFVLENNALAIQTTAYDTSETFFKMFIDGLTIIHEAVRLDFTERIGLRYFDAVLPKTNETLADYLTLEVLGLFYKLGDNPSHSYSETVTLNTSGKLVSRVIIQDGQVGLPPEIMSLAPKIKDKFTSPSGRHAVIDTDAFDEKREPFDLGKIGTKLVSLHNEITKSFKATITPHALKVWE